MWINVADNHHGSIVFWWSSRFHHSECSSSLFFFSDTYFNNEYEIFFQLFLKIFIVVYMFSTISIPEVWVKTLKLKHRQMIDRPNTNNYFHSVVVVFSLSLAPSRMSSAYIDPPEKQQSIWRWLHVVLWHTLTLVENFCFKKAHHPAVQAHYNKKKIEIKKETCCRMFVVAAFNRPFKWLA